MKFRDVVIRSALVAVLAVLSLFAGMAPVAAQTDDGADLACGYWFFAVVDDPSDDGSDPCPEPTDAELRLFWGDVVLQGFESFAEEHGTYKVPNSGFEGRGNGWAIYEGNRYPRSTVGALMAEGYVPDITNTELWARTTALASTEGVVTAYRCSDRVAVFNLHGGGHASTEDVDWWADNGCSRYPIDTLGATYFEVSRPLGHLDGASANESIRVQALEAMYVALGSYRNANGTYHVPNTGFNNGGTGWAFYQGGTYATSIASVLIDEGHLDADPSHDPLWGATTQLAEGEGAVMVYRCKDRVAVFTRHSTAEASTWASDWWADNDCNRYPIDTLGATYFKVSAPDDCYCVAAGYFFF